MVSVATVRSEVEPAPQLTAVVLAAGQATRMGGNKLTLKIAGVPMLERVLNACEHLPTVLVVGPDNAAIASERPNVLALVNDDPDAGMTRSLKLAHAAIDPAHRLAVLLGDKPLVTRALLDRIAAGAANHDIAFPVDAGVGGHPGILSPLARKLIPELPDGDGLQRLRDDPRLSRLPIDETDPGAYLDVDDERSLREILRHTSY